jgi:excisionase family DNA binding protein
MALLTVQETAKVLKVSPITVRRYIAAGRLPAVKVGKGIRVREESLDGIIQPVEAKQSPQAPDKPARTRLRKPSAEALLNLIGIGSSAEPTDVAKHKDEYLAEAYEARRE